MAEISTAKPPAAPATPAVLSTNVPASATSAAASFRLPPAPTPSPKSPPVSALFPDNKSDIVNSTYAHEPRPVRVIFLGAGLAGVAFAYKARLVEQLTYTVYERQAEAGGVWVTHRYPGISCDVPAHGYSFTFRPNPDWSRFYAEGPEIRAWLQQQAREYGMMEHTRFRHEVRKATWDEARGLWTVEVEDLATGRTFTDEAEVFINGGGALNNWKWPGIEGLHSFGGPLLHTAHWDDSVDVSGRRVAVIGSGASAIQVVPAIHPRVQSLVSFQRSPTYIAPDFAGDLAPDGRNTLYSAEQRQAWREHPETLVAYRREIEHAMSARFPAFYKGSVAQQKGRAAVAAGMRQRLEKAGRPDLADRLIPSAFGLGCRRVTPGPGYLETLASANTTVVTAGIRTITADGIIDNDGHHHAVDVVVCATGYDTSFVPRFPIVGREGKNLQDVWAAPAGGAKGSGAKAYLSLAVPGFPNYFCILGPNAPVSNGSLVAALEHQLDYCLQFVRKVQTERVRAFVVNADAAAEFDEWKNDMMKGLAFTGACTSWYKNGTADGLVTGPWPGSVNHFLEIIRQPRFEDYHFTYLGRNRFTYFGDGRSPKEAKGEPLGWYMN